MIVVDLERPHSLPGGDAASRLVYTATASDVRHVLVERTERDLRADVLRALAGGTCGTCRLREACVRSVDPHYRKEVRLPLPSFPCRVPPRTRSSPSSPKAPALDDAEAVLKIRALRRNGDFDRYWRFHLRRDHERVHVARYANPEILRAS